jgi:hypothetical protein
MANTKRHLILPQVAGVVVSSIDRKARTREYKETPPDAGVYQIRNTTTGRSLVASSVNPAGRLNRQRFQLKAGSHPHAELQADWNELGEQAFEFTIVDLLEPKDEPTYDPKEELAVLETLWRDKLAASGEPLYEGLRGGS